MELQEDITLVKSEWNKDLRGKNWFSSSVILALKRNHKRDVMNDQIRNQNLPSNVLNFEVNCYTSD
tara:strand:- start:549 stop:746 length:198 start_codon:yes stop_codon:yes gene_type:complete